MTPAGITVGVSFDFSKGFTTDFPRAAAKLESLFKTKLNSNNISQPLGRISSSASELTKSLDAANARVIAFGASVGIIYNIQRAFTSLVKSTIDVEKRLADINVVLGANSSNLSKFADQLFQIGNRTGQAFDVAAEAALEFSRQGLSLQETLKRTSDALVLSRLSGLSAKDSVESLTASVNSFNKTLLTTTDIVNKFAAVDAAFAVSSADLAEGLKRVGSTAQDAGVDINELIGLITTAQQITSRGGAVIGNALKTVFARISDPGAIKDLQSLGVAIDNTQNGVQKLKALAAALATADNDTSALIKKTAGGVYQLNQVSSILSDLNSKYSIYARATRQAGEATDEALARNEELNKTLSSSLNALQNNVTSAFSKIGNSTIKNPLGALVEGSNKLLESFNADGAGSSIGQAFLGALQDYITGPGAIYFVTIGANLLNNFRKFTLESIKELRTFSVGQQERLTNEAAIIQLLGREPALQASIAKGETSIAEAQAQVVRGLQSELLAREKIAAIAKAISPSLKEVGITFDKNSGTAKRSYAMGLIPTPDESAREVAAAKAAGYTPGQVRAGNISGLGRVVYNTAERILNIPGSSQPAIVPPRNSKAGSKYAQGFQAAMGFNPYEIPNFAFVRKIDSRTSAVENEFGSAFFSKEGNTARIGGISSAAKGYGVSRFIYEDLFKVLVEDGVKAVTGQLTPQGLKPRSDHPIDLVKADIPQVTRGRLGKYSILGVGNQEFRLKGGTAFDEDLAKYSKQISSALRNGGDIDMTTYLANGLNPIARAISREAAAGISPSMIRIGSSGSLVSSGNPAGLGIYNLRDEPAGLQQGISRAYSQGLNPKTHGIPNFAGGMYQQFPIPDPPAPFFQRKIGAFGQEAGYQKLLADEAKALSKAWKDNTISYTKLNQTIKDIGASFDLSKKGLKEFTNYIKSSGGKIEEFTKETPRNDIYNRYIIPNSLLPASKTPVTFNQNSLIPGAMFPPNYPPLPGSFNPAPNVTSASQISALAQTKLAEQAAAAKDAQITAMYKAIGGKGLTTAQSSGTSVELQPFEAQQRRQRQINDYLDSGTPDSRTRESLLQEQAEKNARITERIKQGSALIEQGRIDKISSLSNSAFSIKNIFSFSKIAEKLEGQGLRKEEINRLKSEVTSRNQQRAFNASFVLPFVTSAVETAIGTETRGQRIGGSVVSALGNTASFGATGFSIGGGVGAGIGAAAGLAASLPSVFDAVNSNLPELTKELKRLSEASASSRASLANFSNATQKLFGISSGEISFRPSDKERLITQQNVELRTVSDLKIRNRIGEALDRGNIQEAIAGFSDFDAIKQQGERFGKLRTNIEDSKKEFNIPFFKQLLSLPLTSAEGFNPGAIGSGTANIDLDNKQKELLKKQVGDIFKEFGNAINSDGVSIVKLIEQNKNVLAGVQGSTSSAQLIKTLNEFGQSSGFEGLGDIFKLFNGRVIEDAFKEFQNFFSPEAIKRNNEQLIRSSESFRKVQESTFDLTSRLLEASSAFDKIGRSLSTLNNGALETLQNTLGSNKINRDLNIGKNSFISGDLGKSALSFEGQIADIGDQSLIAAQNSRAKASEGIFKTLRDLRESSLIQIRQTSDNSGLKGTDSAKDVERVSKRFDELFQKVGFTENTAASSLTAENIPQMIKGMNEIIGELRGTLGVSITTLAGNESDPKIIADFLTKMRTAIIALENIKYEANDELNAIERRKNTGTLLLGQEAGAAASLIGFQREQTLKATAIKNAGDVSITGQRAGFEVSEALRTFSDEIKNFGKIGIPQIESNFISSRNRINNLSGFEGSENFSKNINELRASLSPTLRGLAGGISNRSDLSSTISGLSNEIQYGSASKDQVDALNELVTTQQTILTQDEKINIEREKGLELLSLQTKNAKELYALQATFATFRAEQAAETAVNNIRVGSFQYSNLGNVARTQFDYGISDFKRDAVEGTIDVSQTIKRSFSDATASIIKDGESFGDAFRNVLTNVLGSIVDKTSQIGTDFLFKGLSSAAGGVFGFSSGGLVSNGSGTKDDVPALLTSGEYVINRRAVQKMGKTNLDAINYGSESALINLQNEFLYNNASRPTQGTYATDPNLSIFGLTDTDISRVNATKFARADAFYQYQNDKYIYDQQAQSQLNAYNQQKKNRAYGALFSAALGVGGAGLSSAFGGGGSYGASVTSSSPYGNIYGNVGPRMAMGGLVPVQKYAMGGTVFGGQSSTDNIPALLTAGEYVIKKDRVNQLGTNLLDKINYGYAAGGTVTPANSNNNSNNNYNILAEAFNTLSNKLTETKNTSNEPTITNSINITIAANGEVSSSVKSDGVASGTGSDNKSSASKQKTVDSAKQLEAAILKVIGQESKQGGSIRNLIDSRR